MTPEQLAQAADDLDRAADIIDQRGWCRNQLMSPDGQICALGAILLAVGAPADLMTDEESHAGLWIRLTQQGLVPRANAAHRQLVGDQRTTHVVRWNDQPSMTRDEVTDTFRRAAKSTRERLGGTQ